MVTQVESLMYMDQHMTASESVKEDEMAKESFLRQQDVTFICEKIKKVTAQLKAKKAEVSAIEKKIDGVRQRRGCESE